MCFSIKISDKTRRCLILVVLILTILHFIVGVVLVVVGLWAPSNFTVKLLPAERQLIQQVAASLVALGSAAAVTQLLALAAARAAKAPHTRGRSGQLLFCWACAAGALAAAEACAALLAPFYATTLTHQLRRMLHRGMTAYLTDECWKEEMDNLQQRHSCCGVEQPSDWQRTVWLQPRHLRSDSRSVMLYTEADGRVLPPALPFSCCEPFAASPCFHDPLQQVTMRSAWDDRAEQVRLSLRCEGCAGTLLRPLQGGLFCAAVALAVTAFAQVLVLALTRLVYTSARNAALRGLPGAGGWAWLWGRGDLHLKCGSSLEMLESRKVGSSQRRQWRASKDASAVADSRRQTIAAKPSEEGNIHIRWKSTVSSQPPWDQT